MHVPHWTLIAAFAILLTGCAGSDDIDESTYMAQANPDGTVVCHKGNNIVVSFEAVPAHLSHGDFLGPCLAAERASSSVLVCHKPGPHEREIEVAFPAVGHHLAHGDFLGPCEAP